MQDTFVVITNHQEFELIANGCIFAVINADGLVYDLACDTYEETLDPGDTITVPMTSALGSPRFDLLGFRTHLGPMTHNPLDILGCEVVPIEGRERFAKLIGAHKSTQ